MKIPYKMVEGFEVFIKTPSVQYCNDVIITLEVPFSEIEFKKLDFDLASRVMTLKFLSGFSDPEDVIVYLNKKEINKYILLFWKDEKEFKKFINSEFINLCDKNKYTIEFVNSINFNYSKQILVYTQKDENDYSCFEKELERCKNFNHY